MRTERTRFIPHRGKRVLLLDYAGLGTSLEELEQEIAKTKQVIAREAPGSLLVLTDIRGCRITPGAVRAVQDLVSHNTPYVKWGAVVVGLKGIYLTAFRAIQTLSRRRNLRSFNDLDEAKDWLVSQS
ncbi:MAG TPA: hypothetical protein VF746_07495 [Longimicrobium sp.]|jgi:hypothetical protein